MLKKLFCFSFILLLLSITSTTFADADLVAYYGMEEGSGSTVADPVGGNDGTTDGSPTWVAGPDGFGTALRFIGATSGVECGTFEPAVDGKVSIAFWAYFEGTTGDQYQGLIAKAQASDSQEFMLEVFGTSGNIYWNSTGTDDWNLTTLPTGKWAHVAIVHDNASAKTDIYLDGVFKRTSGVTWGTGSPNAPVRIGSSWGTSNFFYGAIDEVYFFSSLLTADEVASVMAGDMAPVGNTAGLAKKPIPGNKEEGVSANVGTLSWTPGDYVAAQNGTHNVYVGTDVNNVTNATLNDAEQLGVTLYAGLDSNSVDIARLKYSTTYFWRVDEVNKPASSGTTTGKIWSFTTEPEGVELAVTNIKGVEFNSPTEVYDYQDPNSTYNGKGLDDVNGTHSNENTETNSTMWVGMGDGPGDVWLKYELDQVYKLYQLQIWNYNEPAPSLGFGAKDVNVLYSIDNVTWKALDEIQVFPMATGETTYKADIFVNMNGAIAKYVKLSFLNSYTEDMYIAGISEIRFLVIPTRASAPSPANNATNIDMSSILSWKAGRDVAVHKVYIGSDENSVINGTPVETTVPNYSLALELSKTYYWKVDEVNNANEYITWDGPVWKFSTPQYILIDGFETGYGNDATKDAVFLTWKDAGELNDSSNGSYMGRNSEPYLQTINHSGGHSAPMKYDNTSYNYSEVKAETSKLAIGPDWSLGNPGIMEIWFRADANDVNEPVTDKLYAAFNGGSRIYFDGDASAIRKTLWTNFEVPLTGINLNNITSVTIGVEKIGATGGMGTIYIDDIRLGVLVTEVNPGTENLIARYEMEDNVKDTSGSGFDGTEHGNLAYEAGKFGNALVFDGNSATYVDLPIGEAISTMESCTISSWVKYSGGAVWQRIYDFGTSTTNYMFMTPDQGTTYRATLLVNGNGEDIASAGELSTGNWEHVVAVYDAGNSILKLYRNGTLVATDTTMRFAVKDLGVTTQNYLGKSQWPDPNYNGMIDDFRIYNRALTDGEVKYLFKH